MAQTDKNKVVILETSQARRDRLRSLFSGWGHTAFCFEKDNICLDNLSPLAPDLVVAGVQPLQRVYRFINALKMIDFSLPVVIMDGDSAVQDFICSNNFSDVRVLKNGFDPADIQDIVSSILQQDIGLRDRHGCPLIIGNSPEMVNLKKRMSEISRSTDAVLIRGESGTGKELVARAIHFHSDRRDRPFIKFSALAAAPDAIERELFGYGQDDFILPAEGSDGMFSAAHTGVLFVDEIGEIPLAVQGRFLQFLMKNKIARPGPEEGSALDVRIIASTSDNLDLLVEKGIFRKDLYYRLNVFDIQIPPLRERLEDLPLLVDHFTDKFCREFGKSFYELAKYAKNMVCHYHWPGNILELENLVKSAVVLDNEDSLLDKLCRRGADNQPRNLAQSFEDIYMLAELSDVRNYLKDLGNVSLRDICMEFVARAEKKVMKQVLENANWNRKKAARVLNISYKSLLNKIKAYDLA